MKKRIMMILAAVMVAVPTAFAGPHGGPHGGPRPWGGPRPGYYYGGCRYPGVRLAADIVGLVDASLGLATGLALAPFYGVPVAPRPVVVPRPVRYYSPAVYPYPCPYPVSVTPAPAPVVVSVPAPAPAAPAPVYVYGPAPAGSAGPGVMQAYVPVVGPQGTVIYRPVAAPSVEAARPVGVVNVR